jgi:hypothetical protein
VKRYITLIYGKESDSLAYQLFNIFGAEHRCFMKDARNTPQGTSVLDRELTKHPSIKKTLHTPVELVLIAKHDEEYIINLMNEINENQPIKVLLCDVTREEQALQLVSNYEFVSYADIAQPKEAEDLYFYNKPINIMGKDNKFWAEFLSYSLYKPEINLL